MRGLVEHNLFVLVDLLGTLAFAVSGALAAKSRRLDPFGVLVAAFVTACGGGIIRDICLGVSPPVGISDWRYLACVVVAAVVALWMHSVLDRIRQPIVFFDSLGLGFFAVVGAHKSLLLGHNVEVALILGVITAVGGGVLRDVLLNRVPIILQKEIYALAALAGAAVQVAGESLAWSLVITPWFAVLVCFAIRTLALQYNWRLPIIK